MYIRDRPVVAELIQADFNKRSLKHELDLILDPTHRNRVFTDYFELEKKLGGIGASEHTAKLIYKDIKK